MKKIILIFAVTIISKVTFAQFGGIVHDPANFMQGIVNSVNQIAETSKTVAGIIQGVEEAKKIYNQSKWYYDKLESVNNLIKDGKRVSQCVKMVNDMTETYTTNMGKFVLDKNFTPQELSRYTEAYNTLLKKSSNAIGELTTAISKTSLSMTDKERMDLIKSVHSELTILNNASKTLTYKIYGISQYRAAQEAQAKAKVEFFKK